MNIDGPGVAQLGLALQMDMERTVGDETVGWLGGSADY